jgi:hypothetical protein
VVIRTLPPSASAEEAPTIFSAAAAKRVRDALARQIAARPGFIAEALYLLAMADPEVFGLCDVLLAADGDQAAEGRAA